MLYDVAIVGAGPAGSTAAKILSEEGVRTLLLEQATFPRDKPCGGGLQMRILHRFKYLEEHNLIDSYSSALQLHSSSMKHTLDFEHNRPLQAMVLRTVFDKGLVDLAIRSGAILRCGRTAQTIKTGRENTTMVCSNGEKVSSRMVIGADGIWSIIAKIMGMRQDCNRIGICVYTEHRMNQGTLQRLYGEERQVHIHLQPQGLIGYGWVFPKNNHVNVGIVEFRQALNPARGKKNLQNQYRLYLRMLKQQKLLPQNFPTALVHGGAFPTCPLNKLSTDRILLCGDAGGLANPMTGEGIYYAMSSGEIAAKTAMNALENDTTDAYSLRSYQRQWNHEFHRDFTLLSRLSKRWGKNTDSIIELVSKDEKLIDIICHAIPNPGGIQKEKWKIIRRLLLTYCTNKLRK
ncbi:MAG: NAD(P)/FAD-dependent oxidoreductase [Candidatus Thermoplasmatota archaeon]|nr:NAD(P)/FAD-dependent oxidoreductase [Candidatus Thermoplasmatota archaeon]